MSVIGSDPHASERGSRRSRVSDAVSESGPGSIYDDPTDRDSIGRDSVPPLPIKPPGSIKIDPRQAGNSADDYFNDVVTTPSDETPTSQAVERRRTSSHGLSHSHSPSHGRSSRRTRSRSTARDILRLLVSTEDRDSREALALLRRTSERLELESQRANEAERRVQEANERWRLINQARLQAQTDASRINEELRLYKLQLETAQQQIARANDMITQTDKEKTLAEDEAAKARRLAKKYEMESMIQKAREEGKRLGREQGLKEGRELGHYEGLRTYDPGAYPDPDLDAYDDATYVDDDPYAYDARYDEMPPMQRGPAPVQPQDIPMQGRYMSRSAPNGVPPQTRSVPDPTASRGPRRSNGIFSGISRLGRRGPGMDRNVEVNPSNAPDVATIIDDEPINPVSTPLPPERTSQVNHTTPTRMPVPNFNPDPSEVHPISMPNQPRSPMHPPTVIPPEGYIPRQDDDGSIRLPPPHEFQQAPPTPRSYNSPLTNSANLPQSTATELPQREREPIGRDYAQQPRPHGKHRYQKSVAESDDSVVTASLSIISPPGAARPSTLQPRLSAIPEYDGRYASPSGSMRQGDGAGFPASPRSRSSRRAESGGAYPPADFAMDPNVTNRQSMASEGPVRPMDMGATFSPRSVRSGYPGPRRPSHITTPAPLAPPLAPDGYDQPAYTRPRINSVTSDTGFVGTPRPTRSRERTPGPEYSRSRPGTVANSVGGDLPEINIEPPSRSESLQSRRTNMPQDAMSPRMLPYNQQMHSTPEPPAPASIPGMPKGFVPTTPTVPEGAPLGFVPVSPSVPADAPPGFVPTSPAAPHSPAIPAGAPPGFVPTSPAAPPGAPLGFVPTSPAAPLGAPLGFVPTTPTIPGAPPGFVPVSPAAPEGAPPGFLPTSTTFPVNPLPEPNMAASPNMSVTGALPVLARSMSEKSTAYYKNPSGTTTPRSVRVSFSGPNAGFNSRAASDWDTRSAWGDTRSDYSPRPVRGPDLYSHPASPRAADFRPGSSMSRRDSSPVIPDPVTFQASHPSSSRRASRVSFGGDPASVPIPASTAPSLARSGRASSHGSARTEHRMRTPGPGPGVSRSASARSDSSRVRAPVYPYAAPAGMPTPGTPAHPSMAGMPPAGLESPYSRRLDPHPEDEDENVIVPSDDSSTFTLTTPPVQGRRGTPSVSARNSLYTRSPSGSQRRASLFVPPDPADDPAQLAQRPLDYSNRDPSLHRSASRQSVGSNKSYAKFDPNDYVDPAVLTSGRSRLLSLPQEEPAAQAGPAPSKSKKGKGKKGKGKGH